MKVLILIILFTSLVASARHYPEERLYTKEDQGYLQYGAPSLHNTGKYALTFDDGPHPVYTQQILDHLKAANAKATFFIITSNVNEKTFPLIKRMLDEGHIVASHGKGHDNSNHISKSVWISRVKKSFQDLTKFYQKAGHTFNKFYYRFPYAAYGLRKDHHHLNSLKEISKCIQFAFWDLDSGDWIPGMTAQEVSDNFKASNEGGTFVTYKTVKQIQIKVIKELNNPTSGGVVLQHDIQLSSVTGTKAILDYVKTHGLEIVLLDEVEEFKIKVGCSKIW